MATTTPNRRLILSASAEAIRFASSPKEAFTLLKLRLRGLFPPDEFDSHVACFTIKSISSSSSFRRSLTRPLHAYVLKSDLLSNVQVASALLYSYSLFSLPDAGLLFDEIPHRDIFTTSIMISCFIRNGDLCSARFLFTSSPDKSVVSWSAMIQGYIDQNRRDDGLSLFRNMMSQGELKPDGRLLATVLSGCTPIGPGRLLCRSIHAYAVKNAPEMERSRGFGNLFVTTYANAGDLKCALSVFKQIPEKNVSHWTAIICGMTTHGHGDEAISLLQQMRDSGAEPNEVMFSAILDACCHAGLIDQAQKFFAIMVQELGFKPKLHHYDCLVNLFSKAGMLDEAYGVIKCMEVKPNIAIWTLFLEACKKYKKFEMAKEGIEKVLSMARPDRHGLVYTLVIDLYVLGRCWDDVKRVKQLIKQQKVAKIVEPVELDKNADTAAAC